MISIPSRIDEMRMHITREAESRRTCRLTPREQQRRDHHRNTSYLHHSAHRLLVFYFSAVIPIIYSNISFTYRRCLDDETVLHMT